MVYLMPKIGISKISITLIRRKPFSKSDLKGKVWIADFIFTSCETVCLPMTSNMTKLQQQLKDEGITDVEFVSFSVDPEIDKPDVLKSMVTNLMWITEIGTF